MEAFPSGELKYFYHDCPAGLLNLSLYVFQFSGVEHDQRAASLVHSTLCEIRRRVAHR